MKYRISATINEEVLKGAKKLLRSGIYRNQSHLVEMALKKLLGDGG